MGADGVRRLDNRAGALEVELLLGARLLGGRWCSSSARSGGVVFVGVVGVVGVVSRRRSPGVEAAEARGGSRPSRWVLCLWVGLMIADRRWLIEGACTGLADEAGGDTVFGGAAHG
jgi:hypothetical protein